VRALDPLNALTIMNFFCNFDVSIDILTGLPCCRYTLQSIPAFSTQLFCCAEAHCNIALFAMVAFYNILLAGSEV
jgi:hypothetical protein